MRALLDTLESMDIRVSSGEGGCLYVEIPTEHDNEEVLEMLRCNKALLLAHLTSATNDGNLQDQPRKAFLLPEHLIGLIRAAQVGLLPRQVRTNSGIIADLNDYTLAYLAQCHTGNREEALEHLNNADRCWKDH